MQLQRSILDTLKGVAPEIEQVQQWGSQLRYASPLALAQLEADPLYTPEFHHAVREALSHYWGGPKLTGNRLLTLGVVQDVLTENSNNPSQALRAVLRQAVETMRPADERDPHEQRVDSLQHLAPALLAGQAGEGDRAGTGYERI